MGTKVDGKGTGSDSFDIKRPMTNDEMRELTGEVVGDRFEAFIYLLLRDHLPAGVVEKIAMEAEKNKVAKFTNGHIGRYAKLIADRLDL